MDKALVKFKEFPEDFIVEEIREDYICNVSREFPEQSKVDLKGLNQEDRRDFLHCDMEKINIDHFSTFEIMSKILGKHLGELGYAGTKDKNAWISIGNLSGNRFKITLRDAGKDAIKILKRVRNTKRLPNFFGVQRFGSLRGDNVKIGKLIFKKKFQEAVWQLLVGYGEGESDEVKEAKKRLIKEKDINAAREYFPQNLRQELDILNHLSEKREDWFGALTLIKKKNLLIICQSVQSKIFNDILEKVIEQEIPLHENKIILPGYNTKISAGQLGVIEKEVLDEHEIEINDFYTKDIPFLMFRGSYRKAFSEVRGLDVETEDDEIFIGSKKVILSFILDSGVYATTFLEQFFEWG